MTMLERTRRCWTNLGCTRRSSSRGVVGGITLAEMRRTLYPDGLRLVVKIDGATWNGSLPLPKRVILKGSVIPFLEY
jgi:hypothetical protein